MFKLSDLMALIEERGYDPKHVVLMLQNPHYKLSPDSREPESKCVQHLRLDTRQTLFPRSRKSPGVRDSWVSLTLTL